MKVRRVMPEEGWTPMANTAHRDYRLTWRARGLLGELLSYPDGWDINIDKLVAQAREVSDVTEGRAAMRTAMKELAEIGYVRYIRERDEHGRWTTDIAVCDVPQPEPEARRTRNRTVGKPARRNTGTSGNRVVGEPDCRDSGRSEDRHVTKKTDLKTVINTEDQITVERNGVERSPSGRFAPYGADGEQQTYLLLTTPTQKRTGWNDWRPGDYERFVEVLGTEKVYSVGGKAGPEGHYPARALYEGMQRMPDGTVPWPGKYLEAALVRGGDAAVDAWLASVDLERA